MNSNVIKSVKETGQSTGLKWTLKIGKEFETTPGPKYKNNKASSIYYSSMGGSREDIKERIFKGMEKDLYCRESPGPIYDLQN